MNSLEPTPEPAPITAGTPPPWTPETRDSLLSLASRGYLTNLASSYVRAAVAEIDRVTGEVADLKEYESAHNERIKRLNAFRDDAKKSIRESLGDALWKRFWGPELERLASVVYDVWLDRDRERQRADALEKAVRDGCEFEDELIRVLGVRPRTDDQDATDGIRIIERAKELAAELAAVKKAHAMLQDGCLVPLTERDLALKQESRALRDERDALAAQVAELREECRPFAHEMPEMLPDVPIVASVTRYVSHHMGGATVANSRRLAALLARPIQEESTDG